MEITIRPARLEDQETIVSYVHQAKINPRNLHWQNFLIAEEGNKIIGIRQVGTTARARVKWHPGLCCPSTGVRVSVRA